MITKQKSNLTRQLIFMRHGQTSSNLLNIASGGDANPKLTELGCAQAHEAAQTLIRHQISPSLILTSPSARNIETAEIINEYFHLDCIIVNALKERLLGEWNNVSSDIVNPKLIAGKTPPNGESKEEFRIRVVNCLAAQSSFYVGLPLLIGSRGIARILLEMTLSKNAHHFPNGKLLKITLSDAEDFQIKTIDLL